MCTNLYILVYLLNHTGQVFQNYRIYFGEINYYFDSFKDVRYWKKSETNWRYNVDNFWGESLIYQKSFRKLNLCIIFLMLFQLIYSSALINFTIWKNKEPPIFWKKKMELKMDQLKLVWLLYVRDHFWSHFGFDFF